jgi:hypothetical protein
MPIPDFNELGDLPAGVHRATLPEVLDRFGGQTLKRCRASEILARIYGLAAGLKLERFIIYSSYVTAKPDPQDVDIFLVMAEDFVLAGLSSDEQLLFSHAEAQDIFGASVFWVKSATSLANVEFLIDGWQMKRDQTRHGIIEVVSE